MMADLTFEPPPDVSLLTVFRKRGGSLGAGIPRIEATAARLVPDPAAYARVCGFPAADPLPLPYPGVLARGLQLAVMTAPAFPLRLAGVVHVRQQITRRRHLRAAEALAGRCWVEGHRVRRSGGEFDLHTVVTAGGEEVWSAVTTILSRAIPGDGVERPRPPEPVWRVARSVRWRLPADQGRRYAAVSRDYNPIHLSPWTARPFGFARPIAHGWWVLARALAELDTDVPEACVVDARFVAPVSLPGTVTFEAGPIAALDGGAKADGDIQAAETSVTQPGMRFEVRGREVCLVGRVAAIGT
jgi:acyl dehydratase